MAQLLNLGQVAERLGVAIWKVQRLYQRKLLPAPDKVGNIRVVPERELPKIKAALVEAGYLNVEAAHGKHAK